MSAYRTLLAFSLSSHTALMNLEREFYYHPDVTTATNSDGTTFALAVEYPDTATAEWEVRGTVLTFDPDSTIHWQNSQPTGESDHRPAA